jgi:hypothetical protein
VFRIHGLAIDDGDQAKLAGITNSVSQDLIVQ